MNRHLPHTLALIFFVTSAVLLWLLLQRPAFDCSDCFNRTEVVKVQHDTILTESAKKPITVVKKSPKPVRVVPVHRMEELLTIGAGVSVVTVAPGVMAGPTHPQPAVSDCDSDRIYATEALIHDTAWSDALLKRARKVAAVQSYRVTVTDSVRGTLLGSTVSFQSLTPLVNTKTTIARRDRVKWYVGAMVTIPGKDLTKWGIGPETMLTIPKIGGIGYAYDVRNDAHKASFMALIRFKK